MNLNVFEQQKSQIKYDKIDKTKFAFAPMYILLWIVSGKGSITIGGKSIKFNDDTLFYIPLSATYTLNPEKSCSFVTISVAYNLLKINDEMNSILFDVNNVKVKEYVSTFLYKYNKFANFHINDESTALFTQVLKFTTTNNTRVKLIEDPRLLETFLFIDQHLNVRFNVAHIAQKLHISPTYLATLFRTNVGTTIVKYTNNLRLQNALYDIKYTKISISQIAYKNGFADVRTLNEIIKDQYHSTPIKIRKLFQHNQMTSFYKELTPLIDNYKIKDDITLKHNVLITANSLQFQGEYAHSFNCIAIGRAHDILYSSVQSQLIEAKRELNFNYCRFHNIFGDEMNIIDLDFNNNITFNFHKPFTIIEFLLENDIFPFVEIGFLPTIIANSNFSPFTGYNINVGGTINFDLWEELIIKFFTGLKQMFGNKIYDMRFDFWNEPDVKAFWLNSKQNFYKLFEITFSTIKQFDPQIKFGGFSYCNFADNTKQIETDFSELLKRNLVPDFLSIHSYPLQLENNLSYSINLDLTDLNNTYIKNKLNLDIEKLLKLQAKYNLDEVHISEWNTSPVQREFLNDTIYKSSKILYEFLTAKTSKISSVCYWTLSDEMAEFGYPLGEVHGGFGLFTRNGIKKPAYYAFKFGSLLRGKILHKTVNSIILSDNSGYAILLNNDIDHTNNYDFSGSNATAVLGYTLSFDINIDNTPPGLYEQTIHVLNSEFDLHRNFTNMTKQFPYLNTTKVEMIKQLVKPQINTHIINLNNVYANKFDVEASASILITLKKI